MSSDLKVALVVWPVPEGYDKILQRYAVCTLPMKAVSRDRHLDVAIDSAPCAPSNAFGSFPSAKPLLKRSSSARWIEPVPPKYRCTSAMDFPNINLCAALTSKSS